MPKIMGFGLSASDKKKMADMKREKAERGEKPELEEEVRRSALPFSSVLDFMAKGRKKKDAKK
jgi:hypothetical protein